MLEFMLAAGQGPGKGLINIVAIKTFAIKKEKPLPPNIVAVKVFAVKKEEVNE